MCLFEFLSRYVYVIKKIKTSYTVDWIHWLSDLDANESVTEEFVYVIFWWLSMQAQFMDYEPNGCSPYSKTGSSDMWLVSQWSQHFWFLPCYVFVCHWCAYIFVST